MYVELRSRKAVVQYLFALRIHRLLGHHVQCAVAATRKANSWVQDIAE